MTHHRTRHLKCVVMTQCVITTRQKCVMRHENELRRCQVSKFKLHFARITMTNKAVDTYRSDSINLGELSVNPREQRI